MTLLRFAWRNLLHRRARTGLTVGAIAVASAVLYLLLSFSRGYADSLRQQLQQMGVHVLVVPPGCPFEAASLLMRGGTPPAYLDQDTVRRIEEVPGIHLAAPGFMSATVEEDRTDIYYGMEHRTVELKSWWRLKPGGRWFEDDELDAVVMGSGPAVIELVIQEPDDPFEPGGELWVPELGRALRIVGILEPTGTQDDGFLYVPLPVAWEIFGRPGSVTTVAIRVEDPGQAGEVAAAIQEIEGVEVITMSELLGTQQRMMESARMLVGAIVLVAITISALGLLNSMLMSVFERTREIGIMRATGAGRAQVFSLVWVETLLMSAVGAALGVAAALAAAGASERAIVSALSRVRFLTVSAHTRLATFDPRLAIGALLIVLAIGLAAGVYPALRASRQEPIEALRTE